MNLLLTTIHEFMLSKNTSSKLVPSSNQISKPDGSCPPLHVVYLIATRNAYHTLWSLCLFGSTPQN